MLNKMNFLVLFLLLITITSISSVNASDNVTTEKVIDSVGSVDAADDVIDSVGSVDAADDVIDSSTDKIRANKENNLKNTNDKKTNKDNPNIISNNEVSNDVIKDNGEWATFTDLQKLIDDAQEGSIISLEFNYYCDDDFEGEYGIVIDKSLVINGNGHTVDALYKKGIFLIFADNVILKDMILMRGMDEEAGSAVFSLNETIIDNCFFYNNIAGDGGAIYSSGCLIVMNCLFYNNTAWYNGGAIYVCHPSQIEDSLYVLDSYFCNNTAIDGDGGAIYLNHLSIEGWLFDGSAECFIKNTTFEFNRADYGGAIYNFQYTDIWDSEFMSNYAKSGGGAIYLNNGLTVVDEDDCVFTQIFGLDIRGNTSFINNSAGRYGGAIKMYAYPPYLEKGIKGILNIDGALFEGNNATTGGALSIIDSNSSIKNAIFRNNKAITNGSAMEGGTAINCTFESNIGPATHNTLLINVKDDAGDNGTGNGSGNSGTGNGSGNNDAGDSGSGNNDAGNNNGDANGGSGTIAPPDKGTPYTNAVSQVPVTIIPTAVSTTYGSGKYFQVKVLDSRTNNVISGFGLNLKIYTGSNFITVPVITNANGIAQYSTSRLSVGTHQVIVSNGQGTYFTSPDKTSSIKISKASYAIKAPTVKNAYKKSKTFKITLKNKASGKALKGIKIIVKVYNGKKFKTFTVKTNSKGLASINTKSLTKGTHKVVINIKATGQYNAGKKTSSIKIK